MVCLILILFAVIGFFIALYVYNNRNKWKFFKGKGRKE
jgi:hypothetical protein